MPDTAAAGTPQPALAVNPEAFAERFAGGVAGILGSNLIGIYLHGSLALGSFNPRHSDVDVLVVTKRRMDPAARRRFAELALRQSGRPYPLEVTVLAERDVRPWRYPTPFDFHFAEGWRARVERALDEDPFELDFSTTNADLGAEIAVVRARGKRLRGAAAHDAFPPIPDADLFDSMIRDLRWARANDRVTYAVLNACRAHAYLAGQGTLSKAEAARWAHRRVAPEQRGLVEEALEAYEADGSGPSDTARAWEFVASVESALESATR